MTELIIHNILYGFAFAILLYFTGYVVPLIQALTKWR